MCMIRHIEWAEVLFIWKNFLWPSRISPIETNSAMCFLNNYDVDNMKTEPSFFGYFTEGQLVGVNSGHVCPRSNSYRSRGLWVHPRFRHRGIGQTLLKATIDQAWKENTNMIWSYPRKSSWSSYHAVGFQLASEWLPSETSDLNAFCFLSRNS